MAIIRMSWFLVIAFFIVFLVNLVPVFAPPTWMVLSFIAFNYPLDNPYLFIAISVTAAACGRFVLATFSSTLIRERLLSTRIKENVDRLAHYLQSRKKLTSSIFLFDAITPLPSSELFLAYGLTKLPILYALIPFIIGRIFTYSFWVFSASALSQHLETQSFISLSYINSSFVLIEIGILAGIYFLLKIDWARLLEKREVGFVRLNPVAAVK